MPQSSQLSLSLGANNVVFAFHRIVQKRLPGKGWKFTQGKLSARPVCPDILLIESDLKNI